MVYYLFSRALRAGRSVAAIVIGIAIPTRQTLYPSSLRKRLKATRMDYPHYPEPG